MESKTLLDNQKALVHGNPVSAVAENPAPCANFNVLNPNPTLLQIQQVAQFSPDFYVIPKIRIVAGSPVDTILTLRGFKSNSDVTPRDTQITITVQGTLPDDGTFDHFKPVIDDPIPQ